VSDIAPVRGWYAKVLGQPGEDIRRPDVAATGVRFRIGPHAFDFVAPADARGPLTDWLARRGSSPYAVTLTGDASRPGLLDPAKTHGARISVE
jgi:hypothetical protein